VAVWVVVVVVVGRGKWGLTFHQQPFFTPAISQWYPLVMQCKGGKKRRRRRRWGKGKALEGSVFHCVGKPP
jgi:hypothetical protein